MRRFPLLVAAIVALGLSLGSTGAFAQGTSQSPVIPVKPTVPTKPGVASAAPKKAPGKVCSDLAPNSQAHKDCIAKQAKLKDAEKKPAAKAPKKS